MDLDDVKVAVSDEEPLVVAAVPYFEQLFGVLQKFTKRYGGVGCLLLIL